MTILLPLNYALFNSRPLFYMHTTTTASALKSQFHGTTSTPILQDVTSSGNKRLLDLPEQAPCAFLSIYTRGAMNLVFRNHRKHNGS